MAVMSMMPVLRVCVEDRQGADVRALIEFRLRWFECLGRRGDVLFELVDAVLVGAGPVGSVPGLSVDPVFRRGHGALYDALACGRIDREGCRDVLAGAWEPEGEGPVMVAVDGSGWLRPDARTSPERTHCHTVGSGAGGRSVPGWVFSLAVGLEWGAGSWTVPLDARRVGPGDDPTLVTFAQMGAVRGRLEETGALVRRPPPLFVFDSGYDLPRLSFLAGREGVGCQLLGRIRAGRVFYAAPPAPVAGAPGAPRRHGQRYELPVPAREARGSSPAREAKAGTLPAPQETVAGVHPRYGQVTASAWHGVHPSLNRNSSWNLFPPGPLPIVTGTLICLQVAHLPGDRAPDPMWFWHHAPADTVFDLDLLWKAYLRRFDIEHTFKFFKGTLGWTLPRIRTPEQAERWTELIMAAYTQLRLARKAVADLPRRWQKKTDPGRLLTPGRVRGGFPGLHRFLGTPAKPAKPTTPGPGRPRGTTRPPRPHHPVHTKGPQTYTKIGRPPATTG